MNVKCGAAKLACALSLVGILGIAAPARAVLVLYDNFSNLTDSNTRWIRDTAGTGTVSFSGGQATISMTSPTLGKHARIVEPAALRFQDENDLFEISWDQQITVNNLSGFGNGFSLVTPDGVWYFAGQLGSENNDPTFTGHYLFECNMFSTVVGAAPRANVKYHFDAQVTPESQWLRVYQHNAAWDAQPLSYRASGTLVDSIVGAFPIPLNRDLTMLFTAELTLGSDTYPAPRDAITVDNVFQGFTGVPEPASAGLVLCAVLAGAHALTRRTRVRT